MNPETLTTKKTNLDMQHTYSQEGVSNIEISGKVQVGESKDMEVLLLELNDRFQ